MDSDIVAQLLVCVGEAGTNIVKHAGHGRVSIHDTEEGLMVVASDHGAGIPALALPEVALRPGYSTAGTLGMGYKIMISLADKIFLATGMAGTTVGILMRLTPTHQHLRMSYWARYETCRECVIQSL